MTEQKQKQLTAQVHFDCGCGFRTNEQEHAVIHATTRQHSMTISGQITVHRTPRKVYVNKRVGE